MEVKKASECLGLKINTDDTKYMFVSNNEGRIRNFAQNDNIGTYNFEVVKEFVYLSSSVDPSNNTSEEIIRRTVLGSRCLYSLSHLLRSKHLTRGTKVQIYQTLILPVVLYGSVARELNVTDCEC